VLFKDWCAEGTFDGVYICNICIITITSEVQKGVREPSLTAACCARETIGTAACYNSNQTGFLLSAGDHTSQTVCMTASVAIPGVL
jgi:hypothetical protein